MPLDLVVFGNLLVDDVVLPDGTTRMGQPGGAVLYAALGASLWGLRVGLVAWRGSDYPEAALAELARRNVDLSGVRSVDGPGLRIWLLYEGRVRRVVHRLDGPSHERVSPSAVELPAAWRDARAFHIAPMPVDVQQGLVDHLTGGASLVCLDPYMLVTPETLALARDLAAKVDAFFLSEDEWLAAPRDAEPRYALMALVGGRQRFLAFKQGARGGLLHEPGLGWREWRARTETVVDPTGAGDAFAAGFIAGVLRGERSERCLARGVVGASFAIEAWGPEGLLAASQDRAEGRLADWFPS